MIGSNNPGRYWKFYCNFSVSTVIKIFQQLTYRYIIVSQDPDLRDGARKVPGTPIMYLHFKAPTLEKPSDYSVGKALDVVDER